MDDTIEILAPQNSALQEKLLALVDDTHGNWTYAIFWQPPSKFSGTSVLRWGDGYYCYADKQVRFLPKRGVDNLRADTADKNNGNSGSSSTTPDDQEYRKKVMRELNALISGSVTPPSDTVEEYVTDTEWFFLSSMIQFIPFGSGLAGKALSTGKVAWVCGSDQLTGSGCDRAKQGETIGIQTMACIPLANGVVELGSTELIQESFDIMKKGQIIFT